MKKVFFIIFIFLPVFIFSQQKNQDQYTVLYRINTTPVKDQYYTGTCWAFATVSFLESEIIRQTGKQYDLSEMFIVYYSYIEKALEYIRWQGKTQFSQGSMASSAIGLINKYGIVPENYYGFRIKNHYVLEDRLKNYLQTIATKDTIPDNWLAKYKDLLHRTLPPPPKKIYFQGQNMTPKEFAQNVINFNADNYIEFTSFSHHPYYQPVVLELMYNWQKNIFWNIHIDELYQIVVNALKNGYGVAWLNDMSEYGFKYREGYADLTSLQKQQIKEIGIEKYRQKTYEEHKTTDDHIMHIVGLAKKDNHEYFIVKNSWGHIGKYKGYIYISKDYFMAKTISILVNKKAVPQDIKDRLHKFNCDEPKKQ